MINVTSPNKVRSIIITGPPRSGTTLAASIFAHIGVPMVRPVEHIRTMGRRYEHPELRLALEQVNFERVAQIAHQFAAERGTWAWKLPMLRNHLEKLEAIIPNPAFVLVMRSPISVAHRSKRFREDPSAFIPQLAGTVRIYSTFCQFAQNTAAPTLFFSYEDAMSDLASSIKICAEFADVAQGDLQETIEFVRDDQRHYRNIDPAWIEERNKRLWPDMTVK